MDEVGIASLDERLSQMPRAVVRQATRSSGFLAMKYAHMRPMSFSSLTQFHLLARGSPATASLVACEDDADDLVEADARCAAATP